MKERKAFDKELVKQAKKYIAADVRYETLTVALCFHFSVN